jgi:periplasmic protein TonB
MNAIALIPRENLRESGAPAPWRALGVALALHAALALGLFGLARTVEASDDEGAPAIEIDMIVAAPQVEPSQAPVGEAADAAPAAPDSAERIAKSEAEAPKQTPVEPTTPDELLPAAATKRPDPQTREEAQAAPASTASMASEAAAPATIEAVAQAATARALATGLSDTQARVRVRWQRQLVAHLDRHKRYPMGKGRRDIEVDIRFTIDPVGHVVSAIVTRSSGDVAFDEAALGMMKRSDPVPAPPQPVVDGGLTFTVPVVFATQARRAAR